MNNVSLREFCLIGDNALPKSTCDEIISLYETNPDLQQRYDNNKKPNFTQLNFTQNKHINEKLHSDLTFHMMDAVKIYGKYVQETRYWLPNFTYEQLRIKCYDNNEIDQFDSHIDACNSDTSKRFLAFFWYLNDVETGGETEFLNFDLKVKPKAGRLIMFPPLWLYPHRGICPVSNKKYILSSYLHFS